MNHREELLQVFTRKLINADKVFVPRASLRSKLGSEVVSEANGRTQDAAWKNMDEPSGRAIAGVHDKAY